MSTPFYTSRLVEFADTDMAGIIHFAAYFRYMESAEHELLRSMGFSVYSEIDGVPVSFPRVAAACEFDSPSRCEDMLDIAVTVRHVGNTSVTYGFDFSDARPRRRPRHDDQRLLPRRTRQTARIDTDPGSAGQGTQTARRHNMI